MAKKSLGYVHLVWTCPNCSTKNPGPQKVCSGCGFPQPEDVEFEQAAQEEIITDEAEIAQAKKGPDIHCYYCGARNPADAKTCSQCGADLTEGTVRASGKVLGAHRTGPIEKIYCRACGEPNMPDAPRCTNCGAALPRVEPEKEPEKAQQAAVAKRPAKKSKRSAGGSRLGAIGGVGILLLICLSLGLCFFLFNRTSDMTGRVDEVSWNRTITIEGLVPVTQEDWRDEIPVGTVIGSCTQKVRSTQDNPAPNAKEICGTPYTVDQGSGYGEVVQDCQYEVYDDWCEYQVEEWQEVDQATLSGSNFNPRWPNPTLKPGQREGEREERYEITFHTDDGEYTYVTHNEAEYNRFELGSRWVLKINTFNGVNAVEPYDN